MRTLFEYAEKNSIFIEYCSLPLNKSISGNDEGFDLILIDYSLMWVSAKERVHLAHEIGHCITGSFYNPYSAHDVRAKHEYRADRWAINKLIPEVELEEAVRDGCTECWQLAEYFDVTYEFMYKAMVFLSIKNNYARYCVNSQNKFVTGCMNAILLVLAFICLLVGLVDNVTGLWVTSCVILGAEVIILITVSMKKQTQRKQAAEADASIQELIRYFRAGYLQELPHMPIIPTPGEVAYLHIGATKIIAKNKAIGRSNSGSGVRIRIAKGLSVGRYGGYSRTVYADVENTYEGELVITNKRIVFLHPQQGFECYLDKMTAIYLVDHERISIQLKSGVYELGVLSSELIQVLVQTILSK